MWTGLWENEETGICVSDSESERESRLQIEELAAGIDARLIFRSNLRSICQAGLGPYADFQGREIRDFSRCGQGRICRASGEWAGPRWASGGVRRILHEPSC